MKKRAMGALGIGAVLALVAAGCGVMTVGHAVYMRGVYDDVVYVRENNTLYKRYRADGLMAPITLRQKNLGSITHRNDKIIIFDNYGQAVATGLDFAIDGCSRPDIAYSTHPGSVMPPAALKLPPPVEAKVQEELAEQGEDKKTE